MRHSPAWQRTIGNGTSVHTWPRPVCPPCRGSETSCPAITRGGVRRLPRVARHVGAYERYELG